MLYNAVQYMVVHGKFEKKLTHGLFKIYAGLEAGSNLRLNSVSRPQTSDTWNWRFLTAWRRDDEIGILATGLSELS